MSLVSDSYGMPGSVEYESGHDQDMKRFVMSLLVFLLACQHTVT